MRMMARISRYSLATLLVVGGLAFLPAVGSAAPPGNDDFANATTIGSLPFNSAVSIEGATAEPNEQFICTYLPQTSWYRYEAPTSGYIKVGLTSDVSDAFLEIFSGSSLGNLSSVGCLFAPEQIFSVQAGITYYFQVGTQSVESGHLGLTIQQPTPATNDDFDNATQITSLPLKDFADMSAATAAADDPTDCFSGLASIWFAFTPSADTKLGIALNFGQPNFAVYTGSRGSLDLVSCGSLPYILDARKGIPYYIELLYGPVDDVVFDEAFTIKHLEADPRGAWQRSSGNAIVTGALACSQSADARVSVELTQRSVQGSATILTSCPSVGGTWKVTVSPNSGQSFTPGPATATVTASAGGLPPFYNSDSKTVTRTVLLLPSSAAS